jgi:hypothetical protein
MRKLGTFAVIRTAAKVAIDAGDYGRGRCSTCEAERCARARARIEAGGICQRE